MDLRLPAGQVSYCNFKGAAQDVMQAATERRSAQLVCFPHDLSDGIEQYPARHRFLQISAAAGFDRSAPDMFAVIGGNENDRRLRACAQQLAHEVDA